MEFHTPFHTMSNYALDKFQIVTKSMYRIFCRRGLNLWKEIDVQVGQNPENTLQRWKSSCSRVRNFLSYTSLRNGVYYTNTYTASERSLGSVFESSLSPRIKSVQTAPRIPISSEIKLPDEIFQMKWSCATTTSNSSSKQENQKYTPFFFSIKLYSLIKKRKTRVVLCF